MKTSTILNNNNLIFNHEKHPFHILPSSRLPFDTSTSVLLLFTGLICMLQPNLLEGVLSNTIFAGSAETAQTLILLFGVWLLTIVLETWYFAITKESSEGDHTSKVQAGLRFGMLLFIASEVMFFFAFFWSFFHYSLAPSIVIGNVWPPINTQKIDVWGLPLVNTILLLSSGVTITLAHAYILKNRKKSFAWTLFLTIVLGICFLCCQFFEYTYGIYFSWRSNIYGSIFFITTGFHGFHVIVGTSLLLLCWARHIVTTVPTFLGTTLKERQSFGFFAKQHIGFETAAWYWHFVDVVWLFLFVTVYFWGN